MARRGEKRVRMFFFFSSRRRHTRSLRDWSSDVCSSDLLCQTSPAKQFSGAAAPLCSVRSPRDSRPFGKTHLSQALFEQKSLEQKRERSPRKPAALPEPVWPPQTTAAQIKTQRYAGPLSA